MVQLENGGASGRSSSTTPSRSKRYTAPRPSGSSAGSSIDISRRKIGASRGRIAMIRAIPWLLGLAVLVCGWTAEAKTYRWVNEQGVVTYSDQPPVLRPVEGERDALIAEALDLLGTKKALESVPAHIKLQLESRQTTLKAPDMARATKILADAFRPEVLYNAVRDAFRSSYDPQRMGIVMARLRSPLFKKIAALEVAANAPSAKADLEVFAQGLARDVPPAARVDLVQRQEAIVRSA